MKRVFFVAFLCGFSIGTFAQKIGVLTPEEFERVIQDEADEQIVDVRTADEFSEGYIGGAVNVDINGEEFKKQIATLDKSKPVMLYCLSGGRSGKAAQYLSKEGFKTIYHLEGGMLKWNAAGKAVVAGKKKASGMSPDQFQSKLGDQQLVLVDFHAKWCAPCKKMAPELQALSEELRDTFTLLKIDADENSILVDSLHVDGLPGLILFQNRKKVWSHTGYLDKKAIRAQILKFK
jgi:thioredoxin